MANKYKPNKAGIYQTTISTGKYDENGKNIVIHLTAHSSSELEKKVGEIRTLIGRGMYADDKNKTFHEYAVHWLETFPKVNTESATYLKYRTIVNKHLSGIDFMKLSDIKKSDIQSLITNAEGHPDTQRMIKVTVNQILESAIEDGLLYRNVCKSVKVKLPEQSKLRRALTDREKEIISNLKKQNEFTPMEQLYIDTLFCTGIRTEEALALTFSDIKNNVVTINKALTWRGGKRIKSPKSNAGYRQIDVPTWYQNEVNEYRKNSNSIYLFPQVNGDLISQSTYKRFWVKIYNKINVNMGGTEKIIKNGKVESYIAATDLTPYMFRHNYCTMLYYNHVDVKEASRIMGHSNIRITLDIYTHLDSLKSSIQEKISNIAL